MTDYAWPTWADALCVHYHEQDEEWETYNYGNAGMGNQHILDSLCAADLKHKFTADDIICIMWSGWCREDRIWADQRFGNAGNILNATQDPYHHFANNYFSLDHYVMKNITAIHTANKAFNISHQSQFAVREYTGIDTGTNWQEDALMHEYTQLSEKITNSFMVTGLMTREQQKLCSETPRINSADGHPNPGLHLWHVQHVVAPALGISLHPKSMQWMNRWHIEVVKMDQRAEQTDDNYTQWYRDSQAVGKLNIEKIRETPYIKNWRYLWGENIDGEAKHTEGNITVDDGILNLIRRYSASLDA